VTEVFAHIDLILRQSLFWLFLLNVVNSMTSFYGLLQKFYCSEHIRLIQKWNTQKAPHPSFPFPHLLPLWGILLLPSLWLLSGHGSVFAEGHSIQRTLLLIVCVLQRLPENQRRSSLDSAGSSEREREIVENLSVNCLDPGNCKEKCLTMRVLQDICFTCTTLTRFCFTHKWLNLPSWTRVCVMIIHVLLSFFLLISSLCNDVSYHALILFRFF
jgi:hypothetical protein